MTAPEPTRPADEHTGTVALDLDAIEARANGATPGWWQEIDDLDGGWQVHSGKGEEITGSGLPIADAEFIAHAREDVPALVAEVRRLTEAENDAIRAHDDLEVKLAASMADADRLVTENGLWRERNGSWRTRAEAAEAEVVTLRVKLAAVEAEKEAILGQVDQAARLLRLNGKQADAQTVIAQVRRWPEFVDRAALATGEGQHVAREVFTAEGIANISDYGTGYQDGQGDVLASIADTCCGKCPGGTCYVDQVTGA